MLVDTNTVLSERIKLHTVRVREDNASKRSILPERGSPTALATLIASRAWRHPITPGTNQTIMTCCNICKLTKLLMI